MTAFARELIIKLFLIPLFLFLGLKRNILIGNIVTYTAALLPIVILALENPYSLRFNNFYNFYTSLAKIGALGGIGLFAVNILLSSRNSYLDSMYGGLDNVYVIHHDKGFITLIFLLIHPTFLALRLAENFIAVFQYFLPNDSIAVNLGKFSLVLFTVIIIITVSRRLEYQTLLKAHKFLGVLLVFSAFHAFMVNSNVSRLVVLRAYVVLLVFLALLAYINTTILGNIITPKHVYIVEKLSMPSKSLISIDLSPIKEKLRFKSGQFIFPLFHQKGLKEKHPFSLASKCSDNKLNILIRPVGDFTNKLTDLREGTKVTIEGPYGGFNYRKGGNRQIWIAGGIGLTPFISMANFFEEDPVHPTVDMYYSYRLEEDKILATKMKNLIHQYRSCRYFEVNTRKTIRITADKIFQESEDVERADIFLCGPSKMIEDLRKQFLRKGIKKDKIHLEWFKLL